MTDAKRSPAHTPGPWRACKGGKCSCGQVWSITSDHPVATVQNSPWGDEWFVASPTAEDPEATERRFLEYGSFPASQVVANARRIVACVNACEGIPTEALESGVIGELVGALVKAANRLAENGVPIPSDVTYALAKAKGEAT